MDEWIDYFHLKESVLSDDNHSYFLHNKGMKVAIEVLEKN